MRAALLSLALIALPARGDEAPTALSFMPAVDPGAAVDAASEARRGELDKPAYEFCHDDDYEPASAWGDRRFCKVWDAKSTEVCPEARTLCEPKPESWWSNLRIQLPPELGWLLLVSALLAALFVFLRALIRENSTSSDVDLGSAVDEALAGQLQSLPEAPSKVILAKARQALAAGRADDAIVLVQLACLRWFDDNGWAAFHPSKTNGEYLRAVRRSPPHHALYRSVAEQTDRVRFGGDSADPARVAASIDEAEPLLAAARRIDSFAEVPASIIVLALGILSSTQTGCGDSQKPYYSHRPAGYSALPALLRKVGLEVEITRHRLDEVPDDVGVVVLASSVPNDVKALSFDALLDRDVRIVIIDDAEEAEHYLPVRTASSSGVIPVPTFGGVLQLGSEAPPADTVYTHDETFPWAPANPACGVNFAWLDARLGETRLRLPRGAALLERSGTGTVTISKDKLWTSPLLFREGAPGELVGLAYAGVRVTTVDESENTEPGCVLLFASGDLFTNASLTLPQNAQFVAGMFASLTQRGKRVLLLDGLSPAKSGIGRSVADSRLLPFIVQGLAWVALLFVSIGAAFGPLRDPVRFEHKAFVEHVEAVGRQYARLGDAGLTHIARSLARYAALRHRTEARAGWANLARHLAEKYQLEERDVKVALRMGSDAATELGPAVSADQAKSDSVLRVLSVLITGRARTQRKTKYRR